MEFDSWKQVRGEHARLLEQNIEINERLVREIIVGKMKRTFRIFQGIRLLEVAVGIVIIWVVISVLGGHLKDPL